MKFAFSYILIALFAKGTLQFQPHVVVGRRFTGPLAGPTGRFLESACFLASTDSSTEVNLQIQDLCRKNRVDEALEEIKQQIKMDTSFPSMNETAFMSVMSALALEQSDSHLEKMEGLFQQMKEHSKTRDTCRPSALVYNSLILAWSRSFREDSGTRCDELLSELWQQYNATQDSRLVPMKSTYISTLTALARSRGGVPAAQRAEELLEEMERFRVVHPELKPTTVCVNVVL